MKTLRDVLDRLSEIIEQAKTENAAYGYFAALYRAMTAEVLREVEQGQFDDAARMERLDVIFAQRYFSAFDAWRSGGQAPAAWQAAFQASENEQLIVLQHLMLGVHAHINFDLGIAAAETAPGEAIFSLENDFNRINQIIARLTDRVQIGLTEIWPLLAPFDSLLRTKDEGFINFSTKVARDAAWQAARQLAFLEGGLREAFVSELDGSVAFFAKKILKPGFLMERALPLVRRLELGSVRDRIEWLEKIDG